MCHLAWFGSVRKGDLIQATARVRWPTALLAGFSLISMSYPRRFRHSINLLSERLEKSPSMRPETFACEMPMCLPASCWVRPSHRIARVISIASPDLIFNTSAPGIPRSRKTFPNCVRIQSRSSSASPPRISHAPAKCERRGLNPLLSRCTKHRTAYPS